jgi:hypothetical protein
MSLQFRGNYSNLQKYVARIDAEGRWRDLQHGGKQYRTRAGAILNWWPKSGKVILQGSGSAAQEFGDAFKETGIAEKLLTSDFSEELRNQVSHNLTLQAQIDETMRVKALLKKQARALDKLLRNVGVTATRAKMARRV